jgi:rubrerythrin
MSNEAGSDPLHRVVSEIRGLHSSVANLAGNFSAALQSLEEQEQQSKMPYSARFRSFAVVADALVKVRLLIEQNLSYLETLGVLALARYMFELTVWIRLVHKDDRYGLVFYRELADKQKRYYEDLYKHLTNEVAFFLEISKNEQKLVTKRLSELDLNPDPGAASTMFTEIEQEIDSVAARRFALYAEQAQTNGYGFQAHLIKTKAMPKVKASLDEVALTLQSIDDAISPDIKKLVQDQQWKHRAGIADMSEEYDFIYSYTSRLLHATPPSITTDQKNLEVEEMDMFLRYVKVRIIDLLQIAKTMLANVANR